MSSTGSDASLTTCCQTSADLAGFKSKEASMRELVRLAEYAESRAKEDMAALLNKRSAMLEALTAM